MSNRLENKSIIVTGAGRGIGAEMARGLAAAGARLTIADLNADNAETVAHAIRQQGAQAIAVQVDVSQRASVQAMIASTVKQFGRVDGIFNNAGVAQTRAFLSITEDEWHKVMNVNALGVLICMQEAAKQMISQGGGGSIGNTASIAGKQGYAPLAHYCASKFSVVALTQAGARAFGEHQIRVNAICPGVVATEMWKLIDQGFRNEGMTTHENEAFEKFSEGILLGRPSVAEDLVGVACFLAGQDSAYMTGQSLVVDGGMILV